MTHEGVEFFYNDDCRKNEKGGEWGNPSKTAG